MRTAESVTSNADSSEWTLKLKSGIKFRDGTPYDADAVKYNFDRYMSSVNTSTSRAWLNYIVADPKNVTVVDPLTVKFVLKVPFSGFPAFLAHTPGMILSPTKLKALGDPTAADYKALEKDFGPAPAMSIFWWLCRGLYMTRVSDGFQLPLERDNVFQDLSKAAKAEKSEKNTKAKP